MRARPISPPLLVEHLADQLAHQADRLAARAPARDAGARLRVAVDGAPPARPAALADALVAPLRERGHAAVRVSAGDFLRPASVRLERGRSDPDAFYEDWLDSDALRREVLEPLGPGGTGRYLPALWDAAADRATRASRVAAPPGTVLLLDGALLLGRWLDLDVSVHLALTPAALARRLEPDVGWTLPAYERYAAEVDPERTADVVVRVDRPGRPALVTDRDP